MRWYDASQVRSEAGVRWPRKYYLHWLIQLRRSTVPSLVGKSTLYKRGAGPCGVGMGSGDMAAMYGGRPPCGAPWKLRPSTAEGGVLAVWRWVMFQRCRCGP
jgi:hypothetical protein